METQLEILPIQKSIPQWLADYFRQANAGSYKNKYMFYDLVKPNVLKTFGLFAGYDLQVIEKKCWSCDGTGVYKHYHYEDGHRYLIKTEPCRHCFSGIYFTKKIILERYILNGSVYHIPLEYYHPWESYQNEIKGIVTHDPVDPDKAYRAFLILLWKYNKSMFYYLVRKNIDKKITWLIELVQDLFRKDNTHDDLPF